MNDRVPRFPEKKLFLNFFRELSKPTGDSDHTPRIAGLHPATGLSSHLGSTVTFGTGASLHAKCVVLRRIQNSRGTLAVLAPFCTFQFDLALIPLTFKTGFWSPIFRDYAKFTPPGYNILALLLPPFGAMFTPTSGDAPVMIYLPETMNKWPWLRALNPHYEEVSAASKAWLHSLRPFNLKSQYAFDKGDFGTQSIPREPCR